MRPVIYIQADKHTSIHHAVVRAGDLCSIYCKDKKIKYEAEQTVVCRLKKLMTAQNKRHQYCGL